MGSTGLYLYVSQGVPINMDPQVCMYISQGVPINMDPQVSTGIFISQDVPINMGSLFCIYMYHRVSQINMDPQVCMYIS